MVHVLAEQKQHAIDPEILRAAVCTVIRSVEAISAIWAYQVILCVREVKSPALANIGDECIPRPVLEFVELN